MEESKSSLPNKGNNQDLIVYKKADCIYEIITFFTRKFLPACKDDTVERMVQAAQSTKENIAGGWNASDVSVDKGLQLNNEARTCMQQLLTDCEDYLRERNLKQWADDDPRVTLVEVFNRKHHTPSDYLDGIKQSSDEAVVNLVIILICQLDELMESYIGEK